MLLEETPFLAALNLTTLFVVPPLDGIAHGRHDEFWCRLIPETTNGAQEIVEEIKKSKNEETQKSLAEECKSKSRCKVGELFFLILPIVTFSPPELGSLAINAPTWPRSSLQSNSVNPS